MRQAGLATCGDESQVPRTARKGPEAYFPAPRESYQTKIWPIDASGRETLANKSSLEAADFKHCYWAKKLKLEHKEHRHNPLNTTRSAQSKPGAADAAVLL